MFNINFGAGIINRAGRVQAAKPEKNIMKMQQLDRDCFVKRPSFGVEFSLEEKAERLLDETYNEVMLDIGYSNPDILKIKIPKPSIRLADMEGLDISAAYNYADNEILVSENYDKDMYLLFYKDKDGELIRLGASDAENLDQSIKAAQEETGGMIEVLKLTEDEKAFKLKSDIAHELRHCIQRHLIASTEGAKEKQFLKYEKMTEHTAEIQKRYLEVCRMQGIEPDKSLLNDKIMDYWKRYNPKTSFSSNTKMKFTSDKKDKRYWSIQEHLFDISEKMTNADMRMGTPSEIDAYNYCSEYITKYAKVYNVRPETAQYLSAEAAEKRDKGIDLMHKSGYDFI